MTTEEREPVSVLLPTVEWGPACTELADQVEPADELLLICDTETDPVASRETPPNTEVLTAGEPTGCSGKANALAHGMERAEHDRFVWTDDDFTRPSDWLDRLVDAEEAHGPATVIPNFVGGGWWRLVEPTSTVMSTLSMYLGRGPWAGNAWGGGVIFTRDDLDVGELVTDLRNCLSDDGVLSDHLGTVYPSRPMIADVPVPGDFASVKERMTRFARITHVHEGLGGPLVVSLILVCLALLFPLYSIPLITVASGVTYAVLGKKRWTFVLAYPALLILPLLFIAGITRREFEWAGRRYRMNSANDIEVTDT
jgi:hypothetical protein